MIINDIPNKMKKMGWIIVTLVLAFAGITLITCKNMNSYKTKKVEYDTSPSAPDGYESEILTGSFVGDAIIPYLPVNSTWGGGASSWVVGEDKHIAPDTVYIRYYSLVDDRFYVARHPLNQQEMYRLLSAKYKNRKGEILSYYNFQVSVAPCGLVGVWISGSAGQMEICQFRARETDLDFAREYKYTSGIEVERSDYLEDRKHLYPFIQKEITENRVSSEYWERLSKKYRWKLTVNDPGFEVYDYYIYSINRERRYEPSNGNWLIELNEKAIPDDLSIYLKHNKDPLRYQVSIEVVKPWDQNDPDKEKKVLDRMNRNRELMDIFDRFYAEAGDEEVSLLLELNESMTSVTLKLKTATKEQEIEGCNLYGIFEDRYNPDD
jgi:hypothetical protein